MTEQNGFVDLWGAFRKYILPPGLGGGYTDEEKKKNKENLKDSNEKVEDNKAANGGVYNPIDSITGVSANSSGLLMVGLIVFLWLALKK